ncbi:MAG: 4'-phosphopantetheinyl transferase superfamily protein [Desulfobulbus sp.]|nr:4'-phosphopantetheinyl transferase superfamily protein [Desulfobulbus sp.]
MGCQDLTVHTVHFAHQGGPVFYTSLPDDGEVQGGSMANRGTDKKHLIATLLDHVGAKVPRCCQYQLLCNSAASPIHLTHDSLGKPLLRAGDVRGPAISLSKGGGKIWAALCADVSDIGIDAASSNEFKGEYPVHRVFHDHELRHALQLTEGDVPRASALLWSIKEAVVKALGCAFHLVEPRHVHVSPPRAGSIGDAFTACLSAKALARFPSAAGRSIQVRSFPQEQLWLSVALLHGQV